MKKRVFLVCFFTVFLDCRSTNLFRLFSGNLPAMFKPRPEPKTITEDGPEAMLRHSIYSGIKNECTECQAEFKDKMTLTIHSYSHSRKYLENTDYFGNEL